MPCNDDKVYEDGVNPTTEKVSPVTSKVSPISAKASPFGNRASIIQNKNSPFSSRANPVGPGASVFADKVSPLAPLNMGLVDIPAQVSNMCMDYVVKNFEDGDFFAFQDDTQYLLHLDNVII